MNKQMERLYEAAKKLKGIAGQSKLAMALNASPQTVKNWESRGISKQGMLEAQRAIGCSALWIDTGEGDMVIGSTENYREFKISSKQTELNDENIDVKIITRLLGVLSDAAKNEIRIHVEELVKRLLYEHEPTTDDKKDHLNFDRRTGIK